MQKKFNKKVLFIGMPDTAYVTLTKLIKAGINIVGVVPPPKTHATFDAFTSYVKLFELNLITYNSLKDTKFLEEIKALDADIAVVTSYTYKLPPELLSTVKGGFINAHPALLPEYRGANPYSHVLFNGEAYTGVTLHFMDENFDTGDIITQRKVEITKDETMGTLFNKLNYFTADMLIELLEYYENNDELPRVKQTLEAIHKAPKILPESKDLIIDWNKSAVEIDRFIRGLNPFLIASTRFKGQYLKVFTADIEEKAPKGYNAGQVCGIGDTLDVKTGNGIIKIRTLQMSNFLVCDAKDFCTRFNVQLGEELGTNG